MHRYRNSHKSEYVGELYLRYSQMVLGVCFKYLKNEEEAKDAAMQVFEKLLTDLKRHNIQVFKYWLLTVVKNHCLMKLRSPHRTTELKMSTAGSVEMESETHLIDQEIAKAEVLEYLKSGVRDLRDEQRRCIEMFYLQDRSYKEISDITGYAMNDVKSHIQNGKRNLRIYIERKRDEERKEQGKLF